MRILFSNTFYQQRVEYTSLISVVPPLDIASTAALVRERLPAVDVALLDANVLQLDDEAHLTRIRAVRPDVIVFSAATHSINTVARLVAQLEDVNATKVLVGTHGSALPEQTLDEIPGLDVVVRGEPEWTVLAMVEALIDGDGICEVEGLNLRAGSGVFETPDRFHEPDLDALPFPARDLLPNHLYSSPYSSGVTAIRTTRGCPGRCKFCDSHLLYGARTRVRDPKLVVDEMEQCHERYGTRYFAIIDHTFTARRSFVEAVCQGMIDRGLHEQVRWVCNTRVDMLTDDLLALMRRAGCLQIGIGIESVDNARLNTIDKGITEDQISTAIERIKRHRIIAMGYSIIGFPEDTRESIAATKQKILAFDPHTLQLSFATPLPGTKLREQALAEDRVLSDNWDDYVFLRRSILRHDTLSTQELESLRRDIISSFYFRPAKFLRLSTYMMTKARVDVGQAARAFWKITRNLGS